MIPFNRPPHTGNEEQYVLESLKSERMAGDGKFTKLCQGWFEKELKVKKALLTPSCTAALEMSAILADLQPGDEVIMPSYTFVSTANAFALRGARIVFIDVRPDTMNIDESLIEMAITSKTRVIVPVHYAGVACEMDTIMGLAAKYSLLVIEDAAQGIMSSYKGKALGTIGHMGAFSFHETKNFTSAGEGGMLLINDERFSLRAEIIREKGTNRSQYFRGMVDKYTWVDIGSSYLASDVQAAYLWGQLEKRDEICKARHRSWRFYFDEFSSLEKEGLLELPFIPDYCGHNAHMFYIKLSNLAVRSSLIDYYKANDVLSVFHYVPLHSSIAGKKFGCFAGDDVFTTVESERLLRLPLYHGLTDEDQRKVVALLKAFSGLQKVISSCPKQ